MGDSGDALEPANGPSDSVSTRPRGIASTSFLPFWEESMAELTENMSPWSIADSSSLSEPVNQCSITAPGKRGPMAAMTSDAARRECTVITLSPARAQLSRTASKTRC
ncbi:hypothetical protein BE11_47605 [Sorangium cellulosum]|nr:hypothetical protein BE11_47605 [Sorangium cellulosum]